MESSEDYLGIADWIVIYTRQGIQLWVSRPDNSIGKLSRQCRLSNIEAAGQVGIVE